MDAVVTNLHTNGNELKKLDNSLYSGYYHILSDGTIKSGPTPAQSGSIQLLPAGFMPVNLNGELLSRYEEDDDNVDDFEGRYATVTIKTYKNDIDIVEEQVLIERNPPQIVIQPDEFFRRNTTLNYTPGAEPFIDDTRTIQLSKGKNISLEVTYNSEDSEDNIEVVWSDSFDRTVATGSILEIQSSNVDWEEETFTATITDSYGTDISNDITITIIDPYNHPLSFNNILVNGYGNEDTSEWQSIGEAPEEVGKFLPTFEVSSDQSGLAAQAAGSVFNVTGLGTIYYHKFDKITDIPGAIPYKNQWYPRPEAIDLLNNFQITAEIKDNYFRAGQFLPVIPNRNDRRGTIKSSFQIIDLTEYENLLTGKVYGIQSYRCVLFGWLGGRADQGDRCYVEFDFLDENDDIVTIPNEFQSRKIESLTVRERIINEARFDPNGAASRITTYQIGYYDTEFNYVYNGSFYDGNDAIELPEVVSTQNTVTSTGLVQQVSENGLCKTQIVGKMSDMVEIPKGAKKIRVTKYYFHEPGKVDLIKKGKQWEDIGDEYTSDALIAGLNLRLYPILVDNSGSLNDTGLDPNTGAPVIRGFNMDQFQLPPGPVVNFIDDLEPALDTVGWLNPNSSISGVQLFTARRNSLPGPNRTRPTEIPVISTLVGSNAIATPNELPISPLGAGYSVTLNTVMFELYRRTLTPAADDLSRALVAYKDRTYPLEVTTTAGLGGVGFTTTVEYSLYEADVAGLLNYGASSINPAAGFADFDNDNIFQ